MIKKIVVVFLLGIAFNYAQDNPSNKQSSFNYGALPISVTIGGDFIVTGSFPAFPTQRLDLIITEIFIQARKEALGITSEFQYTQRIMEELKQYSQRNIKVKRADGTELVVDLEKFKITGDFSDNPYLRNDDVIIFPPYNPQKDYVIIEGAINKPGKYHYVEGDKLSDIILFAMGISKAYENDNKAEISRLSNDGNNESIISVDIENDFALQRGDRIKILGDEPVKKDLTVLVIGEVNNPGKIYITKNNTTLYETIQKAGGFTNDAWLNKIRFMRGEATRFLKEDKILTDIQLKEIERLLRLDNFVMSRMSNFEPEDTLYFNIENELRFYNSLGNPDFTLLKDSTSDVSKTIVKDGDIIIVPELENIVYVFGQVPNMGKYIFEEGKDYKYYIEKAGGFGEYAVEDEVVLIKGNSKNWLAFEDEDNQLRIEPGDYIWVPKEPIRTFGFYLGRIGSIAGIIGSIATLILLFSQFGKN